LVHAEIRAQDAIVRASPKNPAESTIANSNPEIHAIILSDIAGFHIVNLLTSQSNFDSDYFSREIVQSLIDQFFPQGKVPGAPQFIVHVDSCSVYFQNAHKRFSMKISSAGFRTCPIHQISHFQTFEFSVISSDP
jgi:hypothetical protein